MSQGLAGGNDESTTEMRQVLPSAGDEQRAHLAERIMNRFDLQKGEQEIFDLINQKAYLGGILIAGLGLFWWVLITEGNDDITVATSFLFGMNFSQVAVTVGLFGLISSGAKSINREQGQLLPSLVSGAMLIVCGFFILEPFIYGLMGDITIQTGLWRTGRLVVLFTGVTFCASYLVEAYLLFWLKTFFESEGIVLAPLEEPEPAIASPPALLE